MNIIVNGEECSIAGARNIAELVSELQLSPSTVLIEHNGEALRRQEWNARVIADRDKIELVRVVAGG